MRLKPKKRLGQNFLFDQNIQKKIIAACDLSSEDIILEIGPGRGELTRQIVPSVKKVYAIELDRNLYAHLKNDFQGEKKIGLFNQDILKFALNQELKQTKGKIKIIGNIPYYISTPIIEYIIKFKDRIDCAFLTVQKEFARRMISPGGNKEFGSLSCFVQYYLKPEILFEIKKGSFFPVPKVDSSFLKLTVRKSPAVKVEDEERFFKIIRAAFNQRRKTLRNSLSRIVSEEKLNRFFTDFQIDKNTRVEGFSLEDFAKLANLI
ncbi:MAG: 16S rRNA (adenine(1518)-N(6)/adenine(1519)-N(6))-dimethyltransferase RsmA [Candidatus Omnitrophica bacterium]|nr:16S rRNA (adenine(1518)-N(6)/adenine(1519)-N(6))-dimethyltransferase RsmA [Candidatus Omnitrophota bacterium]